MKEFKLDKAPKISTGFKTPENYFENFTVNVNEHARKDETKVISILKYKKTALFLVAAVFVIGLIVPFFYTNDAIKTKELDELTLENYLSTQPTITQYEIINLLDKEDINDLKSAVVDDDEDLDMILSNNND